MPPATSLPGEKHSFCFPALIRYGGPCPLCHSSRASLEANGNIKQFTLTNVLFESLRELKEICKT